MLLPLLCVLLGNVTDDGACVNGLFPCSRTTTGALLLVVFYGALLGLGASWISDGAEGILELWPQYASVIGALLLPVLGALPDSTMVIMSGALGPVAEAASQLSVGMGTLAGSTIILLTLPWSACLFVGACDIDDNNEAIDKQRSSWNIFRVGVTVDRDTRINAWIMLGSSVTFIIIQGIAFKYLYDPDRGVDAEHPFAIAGFAVCIAGLVAYCVYQLLVPSLARKRLEKLVKEREDRNVRLRAIYICQHFPELVGDARGGVLDTEEIKHAHVLHFAREWKHRALEVVNQKPAELVASVNATSEDTALLMQPADVRAVGDVDNSGDDDDDDGGGGGEPEEDPREHFWKNLFKAVFLLVAGTAIVGVFSDPMVDVISVIGDLWGIPIFFISFVLTPFCSNASEMVSSVAFAGKKKVENTSMTYSQLYGAVTLNATMVLGVFLGIVAFRGLPWTYSAEVVTILLVVLLVGIPAAKMSTFRLYWVFLNAPLYFLAIVFIFVLEKYVWFYKH